ncbi:histidine kinase dimerization/phospho-acceptor domain-containing protein [Thermodesulfobacteriota bacterium B35]
MKTQPQQYDMKKVSVIIFLVLAISGLHLFMTEEYVTAHVVARELYFLPIILATFWFGLYEGVLTSVAITVFYLPFSFLNWDGFVPGDVDRILEVALFNIVAVVLGILRDREKAREKEKREAIAALAATVAHEMNTPLFVALGTLDLMQDEVDADSELGEDMKRVIDNLKTMKELVREIGAIEDIVTRDYDGTSSIVDLKKSASVNNKRFDAKAMFCEIPAA